MIHRKVPAANRRRIALENDNWEAASRCWPEIEAAPWGFEWYDIALAYAAANSDGLPLVRAFLADPGEQTCHKAFIDWLTEHEMIPESELPLALWPTPDYQLDKIRTLLVAA